MTTSDSQPVATQAQLLKAVIISGILAGVLLITVVLPAEYGIDPIGTGRALGLTSLSAASESSEAKPAATTQSAPASVLSFESTPFRSDEVTVTLQPGTGTEVKATMEAGDRFSFSWAAEGGLVNYDMHGEPPHAGNDFTSHKKDTQQRISHGTFTAPFAGTHGWWWANKGTAPVTVTLKTSGYYSDMRQR